MSNVDNGFRQEVGGTKNAPFFAGTNITTNVSFAIAAGGANVSEIAISLLDGASALVAQAQLFEVWLSDAATGATLTTTGASGTVQVKSASGDDFAVFTAKKALLAQSLVTGIYTLEITDSGKTGFYVCVRNPFTGLTEVSRQLVSGDYGA